MFRFLKYTPNEDKDDAYGFMGIASIVYDEKIIINYSVQSNKEKNGFFIVPFSKKLNSEWQKAILFDSNIKNEELLGMIRENVNAHYSGSQPVEQPALKKKTNEEVDCPF